MSERGPRNRTAEFEEELRNPRSVHYGLRLYVLGATPKSLEAIDRTRALCERHLSGCYDLKVIDLYQHPGSAMRDGIVATPTLVREAPLPLRRLVGTLANSASVLFALGVVSNLADGVGCVRQ